MKIDLSGLREKDVLSVSIEGEIKKDMLDITGREIHFVKPIKYEGAIYKTDSGFFAQVNISYSYSEICGRCLESFTKDGTAVLTGQLIKKEENQLEDEIEDAIYYEGDEVSLKDDIINAIILSLPMKPLCSENCKGICPHCGANLNVEKCNCEEENIDPRLAILKDLIIDN